MSNCKMLLTLVLLVLTCAITGYGWERVYGGDNADIPLDIASTSDGGFVVVGKTASFGDENGDVYLLRFDSAGDTLWTKTYGDSAANFGSSVIEKPDGGFVIVGFSTEPGTGTPLRPTSTWIANGLIILTDSLGNELDRMVLAGMPNYWALRTVIHAEDGSYVALGGEKNLMGTSWIYMLKFTIISEEIETLWSSRYSEGTAMCGASLIEHSSGGYFSTGYSGFFPPGMFLLKTSVDGDSLWFRNDYAPFSQETYSDSTDTIPTPIHGLSILETVSSDILILSEGADHFNNNKCSYVVKTDVNGDTIWTKRYGSNLSLFSSMTKADISEFILTGYSLDSGNEDMRLMKIDNSGATMWNRLIGDAEDERGIDIIGIAGDNYIVCGYRAYSESDTDIVITAVDSVGHELIAGLTDNPLRPDEVDISAYPNPFNSAVKVSVPADWNAEIFDIKGQLIKRLGDGTQIWTPKTGTVSGIYLLRAVSPNGNEVSKRIVYMK